MLARVPNLPDARARDIVTDALRWALTNPENFSTYLRDKINRNVHTPNIVAFINLMDGVSQASKTWKRPVREIVHYRQAEFEKTLIDWHALYSRPELAEIDPPAGPAKTSPWRSAGYP